MTPRASDGSADPEADDVGDLHGGPEAAARRWRVVPFGLIVVLCTPAMWWFGTSGMESSLSFAWVGAAYLVLTHRATSLADGARPDRPRWQCMVLGLGWLVRPEYVLFSTVFLVAWLVVHHAPWHQRLRSVGWMLVLPGLYQVFRMGYFGALVPNTALAKSAGRVDWGLGVDYLQDFISYERLGIPLAACCAWLVLMSVLGWRRDVRRLIAMLAPSIGALALILYVVRSGGEATHARLLVVPYFALLLPVQVIDLHPDWRPRRWIAALGGTAVAIVCAWGAVVAASAGLVSPDYARASVRFGALSDPLGPDPLEATDLVESHGRRAAAVLEARDAAARGEDVLITSDVFSGSVISRDPLAEGSGVHLVVCCVGARAVAAGPGVFMVDRFALADPIGSHLDIDETYAFYTFHAGKIVPDPWILGRYTLAGRPASPGEASVRHALQCGELKELWDATHEPMSPSRFVENVFAAPRLTALRIPLVPEAAEAHFCAPSS